jgi:hypothetical protein
MFFDDIIDVALQYLFGEIVAQAMAQIQLGAGFDGRHQHDTVDDGSDDQEGDNHRQEAANKELE